MPGLALASATRELLRMAGLVEVMLAPAMELYETGDREKIRQLRRIEREVDQIHSAIKLYLAQIPYAEADDEDPAPRRRAVGLRHQPRICRRRHRQEPVAPGRGAARQESSAFRAKAGRSSATCTTASMANMQLALNVLVSKDRESARQLLEEKDQMRTAERASYGRHLQAAAERGSAQHREQRRPSRNGAGAEDDQFAAGDGRLSRSSATAATCSTAGCRRIARSA